MENIEYTPEQKDEIRKRELAILKAENQMLEEAKNNVTNTDKLDEIAKIKTLNDLNTAINDNKKQAKVYRTRFRMLIEAQLELLKNDEWEELVHSFDEEYVEE